MGLIPESKTGKIAFFLSKVDPWGTNATAIGTTSAEVTAMGTKLTAAQDAVAAQVSAADAAKTATATADDAVKALAIAGSDIVKQIRTKAATAGNSVYALAQIPAPATPSPVGPPGTATNFKVGLLQDGSVVLKWKCSNPAGAGGTMYQVSRKIGSGGTGAFTPLATTGLRKLTDSTLPAGTASVTYQIIATRSTAQGSPALFIVNFGTSGSGEMTASVVSAPRMAA